MTAPAPSPAEQAVIDRFGIFEPEARVVEEVARAMEDACGDDATWLSLAAAAVAAYRAAQDGGAEGETCPCGRGRYIVDHAAWCSPAQDGGAEEAVRDDREPKVCPRCGQTCTYDGWDHVHKSGIGIGSCSPQADR